MKIIKIVPALSDVFFLRLVLLYLGVLLVLLLMPMTQTTIWFDAIQDVSHIILFGMLSLLVIETLRRKSRLPILPRYVLTFVMVVFFGIASEIIQNYTGRDPDIGDVMRDAGGEFIALALYALTDLQIRWGNRSGGWIKKLLLYSAICLFLVMLFPFFRTIAAYDARNKQMPELCNFKNPLQSTFVKTKNAVFQIQRISNSHQAPGISLMFLPGNYSGLIINEPYPDWRPYRNLILTITLPDLDSAAVQLRIDDAIHNEQYEDRFNGTMLLHTGINNIKIPLQTIQNGLKSRPMHMNKIRSLMIFANTEKSFLITINRIALE